MSPNQASDAAAGAAASEAAAPSDLDRALERWALRHGAARPVARALALANQAVAHGHACVELAAIAPAQLDGVGVDDLRAALAASPLAGEPGAVAPLIVDRGRLYLQRYHAYETRLAARLRALMAAPAESVDVARLQPGNGVFAANTDGTRATDWQAVAAFAALRHRLSVISGGPGTGKTYTVVRLLRVLVETALHKNQPPPLVALAAPTGKAAARMLEAVRGGLDDMAAEPGFDQARVAQYLPQTARTLHRLLGLTGASTQPRFDADNPLPFEVVVVDEASMVDLPMMAKLTEAIADGARLVLLGDRYQLASVESGSVLAEICANAGVNRFTADQQAAAGALLAAPTEPAASALADHVVTLRAGRRFDAASAVGRLAAAVNAGDAETTHALLAAGSDELVYSERADAPAVARLMDRLAEDYADLVTATDPACALAELGKQCVLTAVRRGPAGSETVNAGVRERLARRFDFNPARAWFHGRPVMVRQNDYRAALYNGDIGVALAGAHGQLRVWFAGENGPRPFLPGALPVHDTAYALTIHKSQGSEFEAVTMLLPERDSPLLTRELLYTGLTRARRRLYVFAAPATIERTVSRRVQRCSGLAERLAGPAAD